MLLSVAWAASDDVPERLADRVLLGGVAGSGHVFAKIMDAGTYVESAPPVLYFQVADDPPQQITGSNHRTPGTRADALYNARIMAPTRHRRLQELPDIIARMVPDAVTASVILTLTIVALALALGNPITDLGRVSPGLVDAAAVHDADDTHDRAQRSPRHHFVFPEDRRQAGKHAPNT